MLRELAISESRAPGGVTLGAPLSAGTTVEVERRRPLLLIVHYGDPRLAMLERVLSDLGYRAVAAACPEEALAAIARGPVPDVLLTADAASGTRRATGFARECLAHWPGLRVLYIAFFPRAEPEAPGARESLLAAPFNAQQLEAALATLWPAAGTR